MYKQAEAVRRALGRDSDQGQGLVAEAEVEAAAVRAAPEVMGTEAEVVGSMAKAARAALVLVNTVLAAPGGESKVPMVPWSALASSAALVLASSAVLILASGKDLVSLHPSSCTSSPMHRQYGDQRRHHTQRDTSARLDQHDKSDGILEWVCEPRPGGGSPARRNCLGRVCLGPPCRRPTGTACHLSYNLCGSQRFGQRRRGGYGHLPESSKYRNTSRSRHSTVQSSSC